VVRIALGLYPSGCLRSLAAEGHAGSGIRGADPICAAVSVLLRTTLNVLRREEAVTYQGSLPGEGRTSITVTSYQAAAGERLLGITNFLLTGLFDLAAEHPEHVSITFDDEHTEA
jgi:uncharacterized protein YsxB (DUF464 family)